MSTQKHSGGNELGMSPVHMTGGEGAGGRWGRGSWRGGVGFLIHPDRCGTQSHQARVGIHGGSIRGGHPRGPAPCKPPPRAVGRWDSRPVTCPTANRASSLSLPQETKGSVAVRVALGETQLVQEVRRFLLDNGVSLDSFSQVSARWAVSCSELSPTPPPLPLESWGWSLTSADVWTGGRVRPFKDD